MKPNQDLLTPELVQETATDLQAGFALLQQVQRPIITIMGSARVNPGNIFFDHCHAICGALVRDCGCAILTGGGTGIMKAANMAAVAASNGADDITSLAIRNGLLSSEHPGDDQLYSQASMIEMGRLMFTRRFLLLTPASAFLMYPGGFGTDNEVSEVMMLMQMQLVKRVPLLCLEGAGQFWTKKKQWLQQTMIDTGYIRAEDADIMQILRIDEPYRASTDKRILHIVQQSTRCCRQ